MYRTPAVGQQRSRTRDAGAVPSCLSRLVPPPVARANETQERIWKSDVCCRTRKIGHMSFFQRPNSVVFSARRLPLMASCLGVPTSNAVTFMKEPYNANVYVSSLFSNVQVYAVRAAIASGHTTMISACQPEHAVSTRLRRRPQEWC